MNDINNGTSNIESLALEVITNPAPESCKEIAQLLSNLPPRNSLITQTPTQEQNIAFELLKEKAKNPTAEELLYMAEICSYKYHRIRHINAFWPRWETAEDLYKQNYAITKSEKVKYILDNFNEFIKECNKLISERQRKDDLARYSDSNTLSTSRDPDSDEWKK